jgi:hypothetical protein
MKPAAEVARELVGVVSDLLPAECGKHQIGQRPVVGCAQCIQDHIAAFIEQRDREVLEMAAEKINEVPRLKFRDAHAALAGAEEIIRKLASAQRDGKKP